MNKERGKNKVKFLQMAPCLPFQGNFTWI